MNEDVSGRASGNDSELELGAALTDIVTGPTMPQPLDEQLRGRRIRLAPISLKDYDLIYSWAAAGLIPWQWQGRAIGPEAFQQTIWAGAYAQFLITRLASGEPIGLAGAYGANVHHQYCYVQMGVTPQFRRRGWPMEAGLLFLNFLFKRQNFRKIYAEATAGHLQQFRAGVGSVFEIEGRLKDHVFVDGEYRDIYLLALTRAAWEEHLRGVFERLQRIVGPPT